MRTLKWAAQHHARLRSIAGGDILRWRGRIEAATSRFSGPALVAAIDSDRLYPLSHSQELAEALPGCDGVDLLHSDVGHDGFLVESAALNELVAGLLARVDPAVQRPCANRALPTT